jgi:hypothetical protein
MTNIAAAILALDSTAQVSVNADDINQITWHDGNPNNITVEQIVAKQAELQSEYDAQEYARTRETAYPAVGDQLDMQYWDQVNGTTTWKDTIAAVKAAHPKPE